MNIFQVNISLPKQPSDDFVALLPSQRRVINELLQKKVLESYALSADKTKAWAAVNANSVEEVKEIFSKFPLIRYMRIEILQLSYYNEVRVAFPPIMYN